MRGLRTPLFFVNRIKCWISLFSLTLVMYKYVVYTFESDDTGKKTIQCVIKFYFPCMCKQSVL